MMNENLLSYLKTIYKNAVSITNYEDRGFLISIDFKFMWMELDNTTTYHDGHCTINKIVFNDFIKK